MWRVVSATDVPKHFAPRHLCGNFKRTLGLLSFWMQHQVSSPRPARFGKGRGVRCKAYSLSYHFIFLVPVYPLYISHAAQASSHWSLRFPSCRHLEHHLASYTEMCVQNTAHKSKNHNHTSTTAEYETNGAT